ncbi:MAG: DUF3347 domain-containing protein [Bacteroidia bacterium]|nr:DUF3347 domain-containing protein [Bacteroidia bacterium]
MKNWKLKMLTLLSAIGIGSTGIVNAQNKNTVTEIYKVSGNCGTCKKTIEAAATKKATKANWDENKKELHVSYDSKKTTGDEILKSVAYAGYDNEKYYAPETAYSKLPECCQYERSAKALKSNAKPGKEELSVAQNSKTGLEPVYASYFSLKDALIRTDATSSATSAKALLADLNAVNMNSLEKEEHNLFMKYLSSLKADASKISENKNIDRQREYFTSLSQDMYELMKGIKPGYPVYLDHCPMYNDGKGANWISKETAIKNPYYGSQMMTCGKIIETLK